MKENRKLLREVLNNIRHDIEFCMMAERLAEWC